MPTTKTKNLLYRLALPVLSPSVPKHPIAAVSGHPLAAEKALSAVLRRNHVSGAAIGLRSGANKTSVFTKAVHTDLIPDETTYFRAASITKTAVALLCVCLMDQGLLDPDAPVTDLLTDCGSLPELEGVTLSHLLSHTSGFADPPDYETVMIKKTPLPEVLSGRRIAAPGEKFRYSNLGYGVIGCVLEVLLNKPVPAVFSEYLFTPLSLRASLDATVLPYEEIMPVIRMLPYRPGTGLRVTRLGRIPLTKPDPLRHYGHTAGAMYIDLPSLAELIRCVRDGGAPLISPKYRDFMRTPVSSYGPASPTLSYGRGLLIVDDRRISPGKVLGHQGFAYGCVDGAFWEESTGNILVSLNGGAGEARSGRFGIANLDVCRWAFRKELPLWN